MWDRFKKWVDKLMRRGVVVELDPADVTNVDWAMPFTGAKTRGELVGDALSYYTKVIAEEIKNNRIAYIQPNGATHYFTTVLENRG